MKSLSFTRDRKIAVALYDGAGWRLYALRGGRRDRQVEMLFESDSSNGRQLPKPLLKAACEAGLNRLRVLLTGEVRLVTVEAVEELTEEEIQAAVSYEAKNEFGLEGDSPRFSASRVDRNESGAAAGSLLITGFELETLQRMAADADREGLAFEGAASLESSLYPAHAERAPERRLLLVGEHTSLYIVPADDMQPFLVSTLPLGIDVLRDPAARERAERVYERLAVHKLKPLSVIAFAEKSEELEQFLTPRLGDLPDVSWATLRQGESDLIAAAVESRLNSVESACGFIGLPPIPRDPNRHGTLIMSLIVVLTMVWAYSQRLNLNDRVMAAEERLKAWEELESARASAQTEVDNLRAHVDKQRSRLRLLEQPPEPLSGDFVTVLETVARNMPAYARLESLRYAAGEEIEIIGITRWQEGLSGLDEALRNMAIARNLRRDFKGLEAVDSINAQRFRFIIRPRER